MTRHDLDPRLQSAARTRFPTALFRGLAIAAALFTGGVATYAATPPSASAAAVDAGIDGGSWLQRMHGQAHARVYAHVQQVLDDAGASKAQREQIDGIVEQAMPAQHADMARYHASLARLEALLAAPVIDTAAVAQLRSEQDRLLLDTNRRLVDTLVRSAQVLTPPQRQRVVADIDRMMASGHHHAD